MTTEIHNTANQRTRVTRTDSSTVDFTFGKIGQLMEGDTSVNTEDEGYFYDTAWNLNRRIG